MNGQYGRRVSPLDRRQSILDAAGRAFFETGYSATSIDAIINRLGGSKRNIYKEFKNKEGLFEALVSESAEEVLGALSVDEPQGLDLREMLTAFGERLATAYMSPKLLGVYRAIVAEGQRFPHLARAFYERGPGRAAARLREVLEEANSSGRTDIADCDLAANHFVGMIRDNLHLQVVLGLKEGPAPDELKRIVSSTVDIFLNGVSRSRCL
jgi:AcrR family transcriptional regulator